MKNLSKMKIAGDMQFEIGQDKVSHFPTWEVKDDETLRKKVEELKHSTFDKSKFTVVGSPNITDDGVASGFSNGNYINLGTFNFADYNSWSIVIKFKLNARQDVNAILNSTNRLFSPRLFVNYDNKIKWSQSANTTTFIFDKLGNTVLNNNEWYTIKTEFTGTQYNLYLNGNLEITHTSSVKTKSEDKYLGADSLYYLDGSIDLKLFSITVDGKEVFSGNKTGLDVIKPDNYTVVGSPVISEDGIASGFSVSDYIKINKNIDLTKPFEIYGSFITGSDISTQQFIFATTLSSTYAFGMQVYNDGHLYIYFPREQAGFTKTIKLAVNSKYNYKLYYTGSELKLDINNNVYTVATTSFIPNIATFLNIGISRAASQPFNGSIDLNAFKIYVDGNLVYRPCLKIPYTQSKTGSKIVDVAYRDRVQDLFEQVGYNGYFTLGENDFTLPTHKFSDVINCYENGINKWEQRVDRTLRQQGSCTAGTEVTLLKPYTDDEDYALSVPYSAKTASSFIPTVTGDWFAEGKITL